MLEIIVINGKRHLINTASNTVDEVCQSLLKHQPQDAIVDFDIVRPKDLQNNVKKVWQLIK